MASVFQPVVDTTRVFLKSAGMGIPEWAGRTFGGAADAEQTQRNEVAAAAARQRLGFVGDVANVAGYFAPGLGAAKAIKGLKYLPTLAKGATGAAKGAVKAIPAAERAIASKVVPGYAARANALERLNIGPMPTISGAIGGAVAAHPVRAALGVAALGGGGVASRNARLYDQTYHPEAVAAPAAQPVPVVSQPQAMAQPTPAPSGSFADRAVSAYREGVGQQPTDFQGMMDQIAQAQGGKISLAQMNALAETMQRTAPRGRTPQPGDAAGRMLEESYLAQFQKAMNDPNADPVAARDEFEKKVLQLRKTQYIDPYGLGDGS